jgi:hypothetical protein
MSYPGRSNQGSPSAIRRLLPSEVGAKEARLRRNSVQMSLASRCSDIPTHRDEFHCDGAPVIRADGHVMPPQKLFRGGKPNVILKAARSAPSTRHKPVARIPKPSAAGMLRDPERVEDGAPGDARSDANRLGTRDGSRDQVLTLPRCQVQVCGAISSGTATAWRPQSTSVSAMGITSRAVTSANGTPKIGLPSASE